MVLKYLNSLFFADFDPVAYICSPKSIRALIFIMYGAENGYALTFLGKKVGRHHSVAPAGKQRECKTQQQLINIYNSGSVHLHGGVCVTSICSFLYQISEYMLLKKPH